jgi:glutathione S-transferase
MKLYSGPLSLFARKIEIALAEKGLGFERVMVPFDQTVGYAPKHPDVVAANPKAQVPVLIDGDLALYDSTIIFEYLEDAYPVPPLYPATPKARARCRQLELYADEIMLPPLRALMHRTSPRPPDPGHWAASEQAAEQAELLIDNQLAHLDRQLAAADFFCDVLTVADIALFMSVLFSQRLGGPALKRHVRLAAWFDRLLARPAFAKVAGEIAEADRQLSAPVARR